MSDKILVTGATGNIGSKLVTLLADQGIAVRAAIHSPQHVKKFANPSVEAVLVDGSEHSWRDAAAGATKAFILTPYVEDQASLARPMVEAAAHAGVKQIVRISAIGTGSVDIPLFNQLHETEELIESTGIPYTHLRPNFYMSNLLGYAGTIKSMNTFFQPTGEARVSYIDTRDVAAVAVKVLTTPEHEHKTYTLTGSESLSHSDIAAIMSSTLGRTINYVSVPGDVFRDNLSKAGLPDWQVDSLMDLMKVQTLGYAAETTPFVKEILGRDPIPMRQFISENAAAFTA